MGMIDSDTKYVVFVRRPVAEFIPGTPFIKVTSSGYHLVPYPLSTDKIIFSSTSQLECEFILQALLDYNPN